MNSFERGLEKVRKSPLRFAIPWSMTVARPIIGAYAMRDALEGRWKSARNKFVVAALTDMEGTPARFFDATSASGAMCESIADGGLRAEAVAAFAKTMPVTTAIVGVLEGVNFAMNTKIQKGREKPFVPRTAKCGTAVQGAGIVVFCEGMEKDNTKLKVAGKAALVAGSAMRYVVYRKEYKRLKT